MELYEKIGEHIRKVSIGTLTYFSEKCLHPQQEKQKLLSTMSGKWSWLWLIM
ncbi:hypothetical protein [Enterococcus rivorum]|uniref:hypothetical protein n=1 Tax=Enterococcus rivorum TaxID=762845 RepID=UPI001B800FCC|nr:hypothetical protein [Enterococcus rivorum]